jgi:hypothetical protein
MAMRAVQPAAMIFAGLIWTGHLDVRAQMTPPGDQGTQAVLA